MEIRRIIRSKQPCHSPAAKRKCALRFRFKGRYEEEIRRTQEKLRMLREIAQEKPHDRR